MHPPPQKLCKLHSFANVEMEHILLVGLPNAPINRLTLPLLPLLLVPFDWTPNKQLWVTVHAFDGAQPQQFSAMTFHKWLKWWSVSPVTIKEDDEINTSISAECLKYLSWSNFKRSGNYTLNGKIEDRNRNQKKYVKRNEIIQMQICVVCASEMLWIFDKNHLNFLVNCCTNLKKLFNFVRKILQRCLSTLISTHSLPFPS